MAGCLPTITPDFTRLNLYVKKVFPQYFMPCKAVGKIKNAAENLELTGRGLQIIAYAAAQYEKTDAAPAFSRVRHCSSKSKLRCNKKRM